MKIILDNNIFLPVATTVLKGVASKNIATQTAMKIEDGELVFQSAGQTHFFKGKVPILNSQDLPDTAEWTIDGAQLKTILGVLPRVSTEIVFSIEDGKTTFDIQSLSSSFKLPLLESPTFDREEERFEIGTVSGREFVSKLSHLIKFPSGESNFQEHALSCILLKGANNNITWMGTNNAIIIEDKQSLSDSSKEFSILLKPSQANLLISAETKDLDTLTLYESKNMFGFVDGLGTLCLVSKANLEPLEYSAFLNISTEGQEFKFNTAELKQATDALSRLAPNSEELKLEFNNGELTVTNESHDKIKVSISDSKVKNVVVTVQKVALSLAYTILGEEGIFSWDENASGQSLGRMHKLADNGKKIPETFLGLTIDVQEEE